MQAASERLQSLDQFRGYTVAAMFLVNFAGSYHAVGAFLPTLRHWNDHCSFADTIMPQFLFAVGFGFRMSYLRRLQQDGAGATKRRIVRRILGLLLVALFAHGLDGRYESWEAIRTLGLGGFFSESFQRRYFQTLTHIGVTSLWVVPVIGAAARWRFAYLCLSALLFGVVSDRWYYEWVVTRPGIDGGPLGFLSWSIPLLLGTFAFDIWHRRAGGVVLRLLAGGITAMAGGYALSCIAPSAFPNHMDKDTPLWQRFADNPFVPPKQSPPDRSASGSDGTQRAWWQTWTVSGQQIPAVDSRKIEHWPVVRQRYRDPLLADQETNPDNQGDSAPLATWHDANKQYLNQWTISQRTGSLSYTLLGGGFSMVVLAGFMLISDRWGWRLGVFRTLGVNALVGYILHELVNAAVTPFVPRDSPLWYVAMGFLVSFGVCYLVLRTLEKQKIYFRL